MERYLGAREYARKTNARIRRWNIKVLLVGVTSVVLAGPAFLLLLDWRISLVALVVATCFYAFVARTHLRIVRTGLLPEFRNPGTLACDSVGFRLTDVVPALQLSWSDIVSARVLLSSTDAVAPGFIETVEVHCVDGIVKIAWTAGGREQWLERLEQHVPVTCETIHIGAWRWSQ